jgi:uncharacterized protein YlxP (DUF503 family)
MWPSPSASTCALYRIIYEAVDEVKKAMSGMLAPTLVEKPLGKAEVRQIFNTPEVRRHRRLLRAGRQDRTQRQGARDARRGQVWHGNIKALRRFKDDVRDVALATSAVSRSTASTTSRSATSSSASRWSRSPPALTPARATVPLRGPHGELRHGLSACAESCWLLPWNDSLKGKRSVVKSISSARGASFHVAAAEVGDLDQHRRATLGFAVVSNEARHARSILDKLVGFVAGASQAQLIDTARAWSTTSSARVTGSSSHRSQAGTTTMARRRRVMAAAPRVADACAAS